MKLGSEEVNGPVSPVWQSLKGLSSRELGGGNVSCSGGGSYGGAFRPISGSSYESSSAVGDFSFGSSSQHRFGIQRRGSFESHDSCPGFDPPENRTASENQGPPKLLPIPHGISSSTTSTTLSNPILSNQNNAVAISLTENHIQDMKPDQQTFSNLIKSSLADKDHKITMLNDVAATPPSVSESSSNIALIYQMPGLASPVLGFIFLKDIPTLLFADLYRHMGGKKVRRRIVQKSGECNIIKSNVAKRRKRFLQDIFTTLLDIQWRWTFLIFALSFVLSWTLYAAIWYAIVFCHGDLMPEHLPELQAENGWTPCVMNIFSFASCFLFSVETQHTIGYGSRHTTEECPEAIFVMCIQSITGVILQAFMGGVIFTKLSRPKKRTHTLIFSREACICQRDGDLCLLFRVGDMRKSHIIEAHIRVQMIKERVTEEGEIIPFFQHEMDVGYDGGEDRLLFIWPMTIVHKIDESSPLYDVTAHDLPREKFEIIVMLEGVIENTGMTIQARSSYLPTEIRWGCRFRPLVSYKDDSGECTVDHSLFNDFFEIETPKCSAKTLEDQEESSKNSTPAIPSTPLSPVSPYTLTMPSSKTLQGVPESETISTSSSSAESSVRMSFPYANVKDNEQSKVTCRNNNGDGKARAEESCLGDSSRKLVSSASCQPLLTEVGRD